jgi:hypothetical protein
VLPEINVAMEWRKERGYKGRGGVVVVYQGEVQGWMNELRDPAHWVAGCVAVDETGQRWQTIAGDDANGALMWLWLGDPDE